MVRVFATLLVLLITGMTLAGPASAETCIFPAHDLTILPRTDGNPVKVELDLYVIDITSINDASQSFTGGVFARAIWKDTRLTHDGQGPCIIDDTQIWTPGLRMLNQRKLDKLTPPLLRVAPDGTVTRVVRVYGDFTFQEDLTDFPFDHQTLYFTLVSEYSPGQVAIISPKNYVGMAADLTIPNWQIRGGETQLGEYYVPPLDKTLSRLDVEFHATRLTSYYTWQVLVPLILVVMMTWTVFWMPLEFVAPRVGLVATAMLTLIAYRFSMTSVLPPIAYLTRLDQFMVASSALVFGALAAAVAVTHFDGKGQPSRALKINLAARWLAPALFLAALAKVFLG